MSRQRSHVPPPKSSYQRVHHVTWDPPHANSASHGVSSRHSQEPLETERERERERKKKREREREREREIERERGKKKRERERKNSVLV